MSTVPCPKFLVVWARLESSGYAVQYARPALPHQLPSMKVELLIQVGGLGMEEPLVCIQTHLSRFERMKVFDLPFCKPDPSKSHSTPYDR